MAQFTALRFTEILIRPQLDGGPEGALKMLMQNQDEAKTILSVDIVTDCIDLYQLVTGMKGIPLDQAQRLSILSLREDRLAGRLRRFYHWPTEVLIMDALTKQGLFPQMQDYLFMGIIRYR
eukprot:1381235-Pyramimonas_sp.AAC.1